MSIEYNNEELNTKTNSESEQAEMTLDDSERVKVLSPGRLVFKRFIRNKLAIVGTCVLVLLFLFCYLGPIFYPYAEDQIFSKYKAQNGKYAYAQLRTEYVSFWEPNIDQDIKDALSKTQRLVNSSIKEINDKGTDKIRLTDKNGNYYNLMKLDESVYALTDSNFTAVGEYLSGKAVFNEIDGYTVPADAEAFATAAQAAIKDKSFVFEFDGLEYELIKKTKVSYSIYCDIVIESTDAPYYYFVSTILAPEFANSDDYNLYNKDSAFKYYSYIAPFVGNTYTYNDIEYNATINDGIIEIYQNDSLVASCSNFIATRHNSDEKLDSGFTKKLNKVIDDINANGVAVGKEVTFKYSSPKINSENGKPLVDKNGDVVYEDVTYSVKREQNDYTVWCEQFEYVMAIYEEPSQDHFLGTDAHGMDVLARIMYGGRISLMVGFVVVIIEVLIGVILGGIAGYFGGWVDNLIMRLVDIFYCIPSMPILIITGALFDELNMTENERLIWMMAILGFLGWAGIARMVRGQILSLREQEFMVAAEATGLRTGRRIFKHLVPNVMPQLIVSATMSLGSVIITESTLSFLGLGVKHPIATWGNMMNNITQKVEYLSAYAYIWVPIGCLICLAVVAFNFVGDGLRDAFDPKMKR